VTARATVCYTGLVKRNKHKCAKRANNATTRMREVEEVDSDEDWEETEKNGNCAAVVVSEIGLVCYRSLGAHRAFSGAQSQLTLHSSRSETPS
jgi:hypothetical protein